MKGKCLRKDLVKKSGLANKGNALIFAIGIILILFVITAGTLVIFTNWGKSSFLLFSRTHSIHTAKIGIENAIWELKHDKNNYDGYDEKWYQEFSGNDADIDTDGTNESRFIDVKNLRKKIVSRYAVFVVDNNGCININCVGNKAKNNKYSFNEGWSTFEVGFFPGMCDSIASSFVEFRHGQDGSPGVRNIDDDNDNGILASDGIDNDGDGIIDESDEGMDEEDEFRHLKPYGDDRPFFVIEDIKMVGGITEQIFKKIKNLITCHSYDLNIDSENYLRTNINNASISQIASILEDLGYKHDVASQISVNIVDYRDKDNIPTIVVDQYGNQFIGIDKTPYLNEIEPIPEISITTTLMFGIPALVIEEKGPNFIELFNPYDEALDISGWTVKGGMILFPSLNISDVNKNSQDTMDGIKNGEKPEDASSWTKNFWNALLPATIKIPDRTVMPPHSYYVIGDSIKWKIIILQTSAGPVVIPILIPISQPACAKQFEPILFMNFTGCKELSAVFQIIKNIFGINISLNGNISLIDADGHIIEKTDYGSDSPGKTSRQKNDPRMSRASDWFTFHQTPGFMNSCFIPSTGGEFTLLNQYTYWQSSFRVKNHPYSSPAELSFIHKGKQWQTLNIWKSYDKDILDVFTVVEDVKKPVDGRININTATSQVLQCLPLVDTDIARQIISSRPFKNISDIVGTPNSLLNKEITKYGSNLLDDNNNTWIDTEDEKELVISSIINLITVRGNVFTIYVKSQKVIDYDNNGIITDNEIKSESNFRIIYDRLKNKILERRQL